MFRYGIIDIIIIYRYFMSDFFSTLQDFSAINLEKLNASASFLDRIDRKFLLSYSQFEELLEDFKKDFYILEISWKKVFLYDNVYMDTEKHDFYYAHQNKKKSRVKVRTRLYKDSDLAFFEFKQKQKGVTRKFRYQIPMEEHGIMTKEAKWFYKWVYMSFFREKWEKIFPSIKTTYSRMTLVNKDSSERLTIDFNIEVSNIRKKNKKKIGLDNLVIVESKSMSKKCSWVEIMKEKGIKKAQSCSKYGLWVVYSGLTEKFSRFEDTMNKIAEIRGELNKSI